MLKNKLYRAFVKIFRSLILFRYFEAQFNYYCSQVFSKPNLYLLLLTGYFYKQDAIEHLATDAQRGAMAICLIFFNFLLLLLSNKVNQMTTTTKIFNNEKYNGIFQQRYILKTFLKLYAVEYRTKDGLCYARQFVGVVTLLIDIF